MGDAAQEHVSILGVVALGAHGVAEVAFDHREHRFDLPPLAIDDALRVLEQALHQPAVLARRGLGGWRRSRKRSFRRDGA